ncbi:hypothetical protein [Paenibacillus gyeongsangnamensis]|uniref:hypothetical protein n=1 Tax=Paenibacillus gyeongsangnamensis TaxID=3388067 RepID=UPI0039083320
MDTILDTCVAIVTIERDFGDRANRRLVRMKYLIERKGLDWFRNEVETRVERKLDRPRHLAWKNGKDYLG